MINSVIIILREVIGCVYNGRVLYDYIIYRHKL